MHPIVADPRNPDPPASRLPFSPWVKVRPMIFVSGRASVDATGEIVSDSFDGEARRSFENLRQVLQAAGADLAQVVQTRNDVRDADDLPAFTRLYTGYVSARTRPAPRSADACHRRRASNSRGWPGSRTVAPEPARRPAPMQACISAAPPFGGGP